MKKLGLLLISAVVLLSSCEEEKKAEDNSSSWPTDGLKVDEKQRALLLEHTGAWCQYCPNGAVIMTEMIAQYGDDVLPIANHDKDALTFGVNGVLANNFPPSGFPEFYVMNQSVGQSPMGKVVEAINSDPVMGVTHSVVTTDTSWNVYPKIQVFETNLDEDYLIQSYLMLDAVEAKDYGGGIDLNQVSSVPVAGGVNPTKWLQDAAIVGGEAQIKAGSTYYHKENLVASANTFNPFGVALADVNPFQREYIEGDILGTKNTPLLLSIPRTSIDPYETGMSVVTIIWRLRTDGSGSFDYVNGYMSHNVKN